MNSFGQGSLEDVAFQNPDGSIVLLVLNSSDAAITFNIAWNGKFAVYKLGPAAVVTFTWMPAHTDVRQLLFALYQSISTRIREGASVTSPPPCSEQFPSAHQS